MCFILFAEAMCLQLPEPDDKFVKRRDKLVLMMLAEAANGDGYTWVAVESRKPIGSKKKPPDLARRCSLTPRAVGQAITRLVADGYLQRFENPGKGCFYIVQTTPEKSSGVTLATPEIFSEPPEIFSDNQSITTYEKKGAVPCVQVVDNCPLSDRALPVSLSLQAWRSYIEMRKAIGRALTGEGAHLQLLRLEEIKLAGWYLNDVVERATINGWTEIREPHEGKCTGVRRLVAGQPAPPVGATQQDIDRLAEIDRLARPDLKIQARAEFFAEAERRNRATSIGDVMAQLPLPPELRGKLEGGRLK